MQVLRTLVIGCGLRSSLAASPVLGEAGFDIVAGVDPDQQALDLWLERHPGASGHCDLQAAITAEQPDVVFVFSPDHLHADHACAALEAGCAVYLEKPLAITVEECDRILATAMRTGAKLYVGHNMRHFASVLAMKQLIDEGAIGEVQAAWCRHFISYGGDAYFKDWHAEQRYGTGLLLQKGAHDIDVLHWLCGAPTVLAVGMGKLSVYDRTQHSDAGDDPMRAFDADGQRKARFDTANWPPLAQQNTNPRMDVEDHSMVLLQLANGVQASYLQCHYTPDDCRNYTIIGDAGRIENIGDSTGWRVHVYDHRGNAYGEPSRVVADTRAAQSDEGHGGSDAAILREFAAFVRDDTPISVSAVAARDAVAAGCAATASLRDGCTPQVIAPVADDVAAWFRRVESGAERSA